MYMSVYVREGGGGDREIRLANITVQWYPNCIDTFSKTFEDTFSKVLNFSWPTRSAGLSRFEYHKLYFDRYVPYHVGGFPKQN